MFPVSAAIQGAVGIGQAVGGAIQAHRAQKKLEKMVEGYKPNASIMDYYNKALQRYNVNPYTSAQYRNQMQNAGRGLATGINALNDRRSVLGGISSLVQGYNDASLKATAAAEGQQAQALSQLGGATQMKAAEDFKPFEMKYNLQALKAGGGNETMRAGLSNIFGGASTYANYQMLDKMYGDTNTQSQPFQRGTYQPISAGRRATVGTPNFNLRG